MTVVNRLYQEPIYHLFFLEDKMKKTIKAELGTLPKLLIGAIAAAASIVVVSFILSLISSLTKNPTALTGVFSLLSLIIAGALFGFISSKLNGDGGIAIIFVSSVITALIMSAIGLIWCGGKVHFGVFLNYLAFIGTVALCAVIAGKIGGGKRRHKYR